MADIIFASEHLFDLVQQRFTNDGTNVGMSFGWREPAKHKLSQSRIVWVPGDQGNAGSVVAPRNPGKDPARTLGMLAELFTIQIAGYDPDNPHNDRAQYNATRALFDAWYRAVYLAMHGNVRVVGVTWNDERKEVSHGSEIWATIEVDSPICDEPYTLVTADDHDAPIELAR